MHAAFRSIWLTILALALSFPLYAAEPTGRALETVRLQLKWRHQFQFAGYYAAIENGYFEEEGLRVVLLEGEPRVAPAERLLAGQAEYAVDMPAILLARQKGKPVVVLAAIFQHSPTIILTRKDRGLTTPQSLAGKRIMVAAGTDPVSLTMLLNEGLAPGSYEIVPHSWSVDDLIEGRVDAQAAYLTDEPFRLEERGVEPGIINSMPYAIDFYGDCLVTTEREVVDHPARVEAFLRAMRRGWRYAMEHPGEVAELIRERYAAALPLDHLLREAQAMQQLIQPGLVQIGHMNPERWRHIAETFVRLGMMRSGYDLKGFLYPELKESLENRRRSDIHLALVVLGYLVLLGIGVGAVLLLLNARLGRQVRERTASLAANESRYRFMFENAPLPYQSLDESGRLLDVNQAWLKALGYGKHEVVGKWFGDFLAPEDRALFERRFALFKKLQTVEDLEYHLIRKDGSRFIASFNGRVQEDGQGCFVRTHSIFQDITARREAEREMLKSRQHILDILESTSDAVIELNASFAVLSMNTKAEKALGSSRERLVGVNFWEAFPRAVESRAYRECAQAFREQKPVAFEEYYPRLQRWFEMNIFPANASVLVFFRDVTERKRLQEMMVQTEKMMSVGGLAAGMAHEINNPLGGILQNVQVLRRRLTENNWSNIQAAKAAGCAFPGIRRYMEARGILESLDSIREAGIRAARIVSSMLDFSRKSESTHAPVDINALLDAAVELCATDYNFKKKYDFRNVTLVRDYAEGLPRVPCSKTQIQQVLMNLLGNAVQAMAGMAAPAIVLRTRQDEETVRIEVEDNGPGMDETTRRKVFEPFFTTKPVGEGTGLGLSVSYFIVTDNHNGSIQVTSWPGMGTTFVVRLPLVAGGGD